MPGSDAIGTRSRRCRYCHGDEGRTVLDLGYQPPWENMPAHDEPLPDTSYPLAMWWCDRCRLAQLDQDGPGTEELPVVESRASLAQRDRSVERLTDEGSVAAGRSVHEFGSPHGDSWLPVLTGLGMVPVERDAGAAELVVDHYGLLHDADQDAALRSRVASLAPGGTLALQLLPLGTVLRCRQWFDLRHGHYAYWSLPALDAALRGHGLGVHRAWSYPLSGGTVLVTARADPRPDDATRRLLDDERSLGADDPAVVAGLQQVADGDTAALRRWLEREQSAGHTVVGYGAASRAVPVVCRAELDSGLLAMIGDASPAKQGRRMPGTDIPIVAPERIDAVRPDRVLLFLPDLADEVRDALPAVEDAGGRWTVLDPTPRLLPPRHRSRSALTRRRDEAGVGAASGPRPARSAPRSG